VGVPSARAQEWTVPAGGWFHLQEIFERDAGAPAESKPGAASFMVGMPNFPAIYAIRAGLEYLKGVGVENIYRTAQPLVHRCLEGLSELPIELITPREPDALAGIIAFRHPRLSEIFERLAAQEIHVMQSAGRMRIALHGYNTEEDVDRFLSALRPLVS
jgi:selenocysteine lyase/cysteine desulfurase